MNVAKITLLQNRTTDGTDGYQPWQRSNGREMITSAGELSVTGTFGGASVGIFFKINGEDIALLDGTGTAVAITSAKAIQLRIPHTQEIKAVISGATGTTDLTCEITELRG